MNKARILPFLILLIAGIYCLSTLSPIKRYLTEYAQKSMTDTYGSGTLATAYETKIQAIAKELGVTEPIIIRKMNTKALMTFGYHNAFAAFHLFGGLLPLIDTPFLFVSEGFFEDLSEQEQRFLIGHELIHIKERHTKYIQLILVLSMLALCALWWLYARRRTESVVATYIPESYHKISLFSVGFLSICILAAVPELMHFWYRRHIEWVADHQSLASLHSHDGGVQLMERWMKEYKLPSTNPYWGLLADHPSCFERRAYCLAHKHSINKEAL